MNGKKEYIVDPARLNEDIINASNMQKWYDLIFNIINTKKENDRQRYLND
jgi:hypothetical protein